MPGAHPPITLVGNKIPFNFPLFYYAMLGLMERKPDSEHLYGWDGHYTWYFVPQNEEETRRFPERAAALASWLDVFDIIFSRSRCEFGLKPGHEDKGKMIYIDVVHRVAPRE